MAVYWWSLEVDEKEAEEGSNPSTMVNRELYVGFHGGLSTVLYLNGKDGAINGARNR